MLNKSYTPAEAEPKWYAVWERLGVFQADPASSKPRFCMVIPPPNVTGTLHMGHALNTTLHDIVSRWKRMRGFDVLWLPGTDHAGIATQNVVEKHLAEQKLTRFDLGREKFNERVWAWVWQSRTSIVAQLQKLGASVDWTRERFTFDEGLSRAVRRVFVTLYHEGLIYRGRYIINWCPRCSTALSDLEVIHKPVRGKLYYVKYPFLGDAGGKRDAAADGIVVATTRPETMLGDTAVAVHPDDGRYRALGGRKVRLPVIGREIPVIGDRIVDPAFGTGAVKVTPAHDPNDFQIGLRHGLPQVAVIDEAGNMTAAAGPYAGQDRFAARRGIIDQLRREGLLVKVEDHDHAVGHCQRCDSVVEPLISTQWFVRIKPLAEPAIKAVEDGRITFVPSNWRKTYSEWMHNIHDWCISRQLWWGHQIPAWHCDRCSKILVAETSPAACEACGGPMRQDPDVLDTWFSSGLWPFSTMGWPEKTADLARYYPNDLLITGFDIIFFWVARMIMLGLKFMEEVPFHRVLITALVRDERGQKMSKSRGNVVDPLEIVDEHGTDAVRFTLAAMASPGTDISLTEGRMIGYRAFVNKLWNASRFVLMNIAGIEQRPPVPPAGEPELIHRWILSRTSEVARAVNDALEEFRFDTMAHELYHFVWDEYCPWYLELIKPHLHGPDRERHAAVLIDVHDKILRMLHPIMPFVTEEIWQRLPGHGETIAVAPWPAFEPARIDDEAEAQMQRLMHVITAIRTVRMERNVAPGRRIDVIIRAGDHEGAVFVDAHRDDVKALARVARLDISETAGSRGSPEIPEGAVRQLVGGLEVYIPLAGLGRSSAEDARSEAERLERMLARLEKELDGLTSKLENPSFVARAPADVVAQNRSRRQELVEQREKLLESLRELRRA